jgi:uncharacterized protein YjbJ (UPF0337 family)
LVEDSIQLSVTLSPAEFVGVFTSRNAGTALSAGPLAVCRNMEGSTEMAGTMDKIKGSVKEGVGKMTGDAKTEAEGKADRAKGHLKDAAQDVKDAARGVKDSAKG